MPTRSDYCWKKIYLDFDAKLAFLANFADFSKNHKKLQAIGPENLS